MGRYNPPPYSPHYDFIAMRPMTIGGVEVQRGEAIDKSHFSEQRIRQMFDARMIAPAGFVDSPTPAYLHNGAGKADALRAEIEREEADKAKGKGNAAPPASSKTRVVAGKKPPAAAKAPTAKKKPAKPAPAGKQRGRRAA